MGKKKKRTDIGNKKKNVKNGNPLGFGFFVIPLIVLIFIYAFVLSAMKDGNYVYISPVFKEYEALEKNESDKKLENYFDDEAVLFYEEESVYINRSSDYFYEKTGVRIFLYTVSAMEDAEGNLIYLTDEEALKKCEELYSELSPDGVDLVLLFLPTSTGFEAWTYASDEVRDNFGDKCEKILKHYLKYNFDVAGTYYDLVEFSYRDAADRIMGGFTSPFKIFKENLRVAILTVITLCVVIPAIVIYIFAGKKKNY